MEKNLVIYTSIWLSTKWHILFFLYKQEKIKSFKSLKGWFCWRFFKHRNWRIIVKQINSFQKKFSFGKAFFLNNKATFFLNYKTLHCKRSKFFYFLHLHDSKSMWDIHKFGLTILVITVKVWKNLIRIFACELNEFYCI